MMYCNLINLSQRRGSAAAEEIANSTAAAALADHTRRCRSERQSSIDERCADEWLYVTCNTQSLFVLLAGVLLLFSLRTFCITAAVIIPGVPNNYIVFHHYVNNNWAFFEAKIFTAVPSILTHTSCTFRSCNWSSQILFPFLSSVLAILRVKFLAPRRQQKAALETHTIQ